MRRAIVTASMLAAGCNLVLGLDPVTRDDGAVTDAAGDDGRPADDATPDDAEPSRDALTDAPGRDAGPCPVAPSGCAPFTCAGSASCYYVCPATTWVDAKAQCGQHGGCLTTIDSATENACIASNAAPMLAAPLWLGWYQSDTSVEPAGGWRWLCGDAPYRGPGWGSLQPDNGSGPEDCGAMGVAGAWLDDDCVKAYRFVCEL